LCIDTDLPAKIWAFLKHNLALFVGKV